MANVFRYPLNDMIAGTLYRVDRLIGVGGMATVYQVTDMSCGRRYAFKHLSADLRDRVDLRRRFVEEGKLLGSLHGHPGIVEVITQGFTADDLDVPFMLLELLNGPNGRHVLSKRGQLDPMVACDIMSAVLKALDHAHEKGVVHRDVKPENVVFHRDPEGKPKTKLIDFGIHKSRHERSKGYLVGTPLYMAPELLDESAGDYDLQHLVDVYSVGITLYEFITGRTPFDDEPNEEAVLKAHRCKAPPPPSKFVDGLTVQLEDAIMRALEKDPRKRWQDAFTFANALSDCSKGHASAAIDVDVHSRITAEQIPTHVGTPVNERPSKNTTEPGSPSPQDKGASQGTQIPATEPGVPFEILHMMMARATAGERATNPGTPEAQKATHRTQPDAHPQANLAAPDAREPMPALRVSNIATRSRPDLFQPSDRRGKSDTPAIDVPPIHDDPDAPQALRESVQQSQQTDEPDRVWIDEDVFQKAETDPTSTRTPGAALERATPRKWRRLDVLAVAAAFASTVLVGSVIVVVGLRQRPSTQSTGSSAPTRSLSVESTPSLTAAVAAAPPTLPSPSASSAPAIAKVPTNDEPRSTARPVRITAPPRPSVSSDGVPDPFLVPTSPLPAHAKVPKPAGAASDVARIFSNDAQK